MASKVFHLIEKNVIKNYPPFLKSNIMYEVITGSESYGCSSNSSDIDIMGFVIPNKDIIFPHLRGEILGFGKQTNRFEQFQNHHLENPDDKNKTYDITIYSIIKYFQLCMENNPNMLDSLFVPERCIIHNTSIGNHVRENRKKFLHKGCYFKFKGYAFSQLHKMQTKDPEGKRKEVRDKYGYDLKFGLHVVRLLNECEQMLVTHNLDLELNREQLKSIKRGEWKEEEIIEYFKNKESVLEDLYSKSDLRHSPDEDEIKTLLLECLEMHYGKLGNECIKTEKDINMFIKDIQILVEKYS